MDHDMAGAFRLKTTIAVAAAVTLAGGLLSFAITGN